MRNNRTRIIAGVSWAVMLLLVAGCETQQTKDERSAGRQMDDEHITEHVRNALDAEPVYKFTDVNVRTFAGVVQLSGFASIQAQKDRAAQIAQNVSGVTQVDNSISLKPQPLQPTGRPAPIYNSAGAPQKDPPDQN